jgi:O-antigen biosynthesis protein WbqP
MMGASLRIADAALALVGLVLLAPVLVGLAIAVRLDSRGPALFVQSRVGRWGRPFACYKLRSMAHGTREAATHDVGGAFVTPLGAFLRRTKLDELPQLWNVLRGDMSMVGPRPCLPCQRELLDLREQLGVLAIRPGITGPGQVAGLDMSTPAQLAAADATWLAASAREYVRLICATAFNRAFGAAQTGGV